MSCGDHANSTQLSVGQLLATGASASDIDSFGDVKEQSPCTSADSTLAMVKDAPFSATGPRPVEVRVIEEPPVADVTKLPKRAADVATWPPPPLGAAAERTTGGASFDDAPLLGRGVYTDAIVPGEVLTDQVDVGWGQSVTAAPAPSGQHNASGDSSDGPGAGVYVGAVGVLLLLGAGVAYLVIRRRSSNSS